MFGAHKENCNSNFMNHAQQTLNRCQVNIIYFLLSFFRNGNKFVQSHIWNVVLSKNHWSAQGSWTEHGGLLPLHQDILFCKIKVRPRSCRSYSIWRPWIFSSPCLIIALVLIDMHCIQHMVCKNILYQRIFDCW